jgi:hypothetical protein
MPVIADFLYAQAGIETTLHLKKADSFSMNIDEVLFWENNIPIKKNCLYVCTPHDLSTSAQFPPNSNVLCIGKIPGDNQDNQDNQNILDYVNMISVSDNISEQHLFNDILTCFNYYNAWADRLNSCSAKGASIHKLMDIGTEILKEPMCLLDPNHNVIAITTNLVSVDDALWDILEKGYGYRYQDIISKSIPRLRDVKKKGRPIECINNIGGYNLYCSPVLADDNAVAFLGIHKSTNRKEPFELWFKHLCGYYVDVLGSYFKNNATKQASFNSQADKLFLDMLEGRMSKQNEIIKYIHKYHLAFSNHLQILIFGFRGQIDQTDFYLDMIARLKLILPEANYIIQNCTIMVVIDLKKESCIPKKALDCLQDFLSTNHGYCSISLLFDSIDKLIPAYKQARAALELGLASKPGENIYHFHEYLGLHCLRLLHNHLATPHYLHPMLLKLKKYDEKYNTDYYITLNVYLKNNCSLSQSSAYINMHRNSFLYRIHKIKELLGTNFEDSEFRMDLLFSYYAMEHLNLFEKELSLEELLE